MWRASVKSLPISPPLSDAAISRDSIYDAPGWMSVLVDTNVLSRRTQVNHAHRAIAVESVARLLAAGETACFTPQNISEFWNVMMRPSQGSPSGAHRVSSRGA